MRQRFWQWVHNCVAHPLEGWVFLLLGVAPQWVDDFHEWSAGKAWPQK